jgi:hypothetical protein
MRYGSGWFLRMLVVVVAIGVLMSLAFGAGVAADGGSVNTGWANAHDGVYHPGARLVGCLFGLFLLVAFVSLIAFAVRGPRWYGGPRYYGGPGWPGRHGRPWRGGWCEDGWREEADSMMDEWHRRAHESGPSTEAAPPAAEQPRPGGKAK